MLGLILIIGAVFIMPIGTEVYHNEITILKTDNVGDRWNVYFDDNDNIRSISCTDDAPWHTWNIGETVNMKYGRINTLYTTITQSTHYKLIEGENNG